MKKLFMIYLFIALMALPTFGAFTTSIGNRKTYKHAYRWTGKPKDLLLDWAQEVENRADGTSTTEFTYYSPTDTEPAANEGTIYYDLSEGKLKFRNSSSWVAIEAGSTGNSLDGAYDVGRTISVDAGSVILTGTNAADNVVLSLIQSDTGTTKGFTITNAGTGNTIDIQGQASSNDIEGTDDSWGISSIGTFTGVVGTWTGDQTWTGSAANVIFDATDDELLIEDDAVLSFGDVADVTVTWNATNLLIEAATDDVGQIQLGATNSMDLKILGSTNTDIALFDASAGALLLDSYPIALGDGDAILFGDTLGTGDFTISDVSDVLTIDAVVDGTGEVSMGNDADDLPFKWYTDTTGDWVYFNDDEVEFEDCVLQMMDATQIQFGDSDDFFMHATNTAMTLGTLTSDETSAWNFGADTDGDDVKMFGATTAEYWLFDASADSLLPVLGNYLYTATDAEADQFKVNATGATSDAVAINFETTDGKILLNADGATGGDIELNSVDDIILTSTGKVTITNTEPVTISGTLTPVAVNIVDFVITDQASVTLVAAQSGKILPINNLAQNTTIDLPAEADGMNFEFWYTGGAVETHDHIIDAEANANYYIGGLQFIDSDDNTITEVYSNGSSNAKLTLNNLEAGSFIKITCDGTNWYITGTIYSDTAPVFANSV